MILRKRIIPKDTFLAMRLPEEMVGKTVEILAFEILSDSNEKIMLTKEERMEIIESLTSPTLTDLSKFKFDRIEANNYGES